MAGEKVTSVLLAVRKMLVVGIVENGIVLGKTTGSLEKITSV